MKKQKDYSIISFVIRYFLLLVLGLGNLYIFYTLFTPITINAVSFLLNFFYDVVLRDNLIYLNENISIGIINACVAGSAYYLLTILNLSVPNLKVKTRLYAIFYSFGFFYIINVLRIVLFAVLFKNNFSWFDLAHEFSWYFLSTLFVVIIWFSEVKLFKIKEIPIYSDIKYLYKMKNAK